LPEKGESENFIKKLIKFIKNIIWKRWWYLLEYHLFLIYCK
jgi:hypothetical protein